MNVDFNVISEDDPIPISLSQYLETIITSPFEDMEIKYYFNHYGKVISRKKRNNLQHSTTGNGGPNWGCLTWGAGFLTLKPFTVRATGKKIFDMGSHLGELNSFSLSKNHEFFSRGWVAGCVGSDEKIFIEFPAREARRVFFQNQFYSTRCRRRTFHGGGEYPF